MITAEQKADYKHAILDYELIRNKIIWKKIRR